jgi:NitT/TauT family transport system substrate-binding protein
VAVRLGLPNLLADVGFFVAQDRGYFAEEGLDVEFMNTPSLNQVIPAVSTGEMDVASGGIGSALFNAVARGLAMKVVADRATLGRGSGYMVLVVRKDLLDSGRVRDLADLRGLSIAASGAGAITELVTYKAAERGGLRPSDVEVVYLGIGDTPAALANRSIDAAMALEPNVTLIVSQGLGDVFRTTYEITPDLTVGVVLYADSFIRNKPEAARRFMVAYLRGLRDFNDAFFRQPPRDRAEVLAALTHHTGVKDAALYEAMLMPGLNPDGGINLSSIADAQQWWVDRGEIRDPVDVAQLWDGSYVDYAVGRLGRYQP